MSDDTQTVETPSWAHWTAPERVEVDGLATAYRRKGEGAPLVYLHGAGLTRAWLPLYEQLAGSFDTIVPEHPGFGDTEMPEHLHDLTDYVLHYDAFFDALDVERPHLVGHSLGAWAAANLAIFYPRRFASLTLIAPLGVRVPEHPVGDMFRLSPEAADNMLFSGTAASYVEYLEQGDPTENTLHQYAESITLARLAWNPRYDWRLDHRLARVQAPTLVLHPEDDRLVPRAHAERFGELIPGAAVETIGSGSEPASHLVILQQPERLAARIAQHANADA